MDEFETPPSYERVEPHYFGLTPHLFVAALGGMALLAGVLLVVSGSVPVGVLLIALAALLLALFVEQARHRRASTADRIAAAAVDSSLAFAGFTGATVGAWADAGRGAARFRIEARRLARRRSKLQYELGGAVHADDDERVRDLRAELSFVDEELRRCQDGARAAVENARRRTRDERGAFASTQVSKSSRGQ
ncbi:MAG TPA: hypothetical protein VGL84_09855 [Gaiellaceae bacterium]|jgi:hypothetical protein